MSEKHHILFVCIGNICRSPTAEAVFRQLAEKSGWGSLFNVESAGVADYHIGKAPDTRTQKHAAMRGYNLGALRARQLSAQDFAKFDLILAMESDVLQAIRQRQQECGAGRAQTGLFLDYLPGNEGCDVPDPYYGGPDGFETVLDLVEEGSHALLRGLLKQRGVFGCGC